MVEFPQPADRSNRCHHEIPEAEATTARGSFREEFFGPPRCGAELAYDTETQAWMCAFGHATVREDA